MPVAPPVPLRSVSIEFAEQPTTQMEAIDAQLATQHARPQLDRFEATGRGSTNAGARFIS
jgi:hypothetical protein